MPERLAPTRLEPLCDLLQRAKDAPWNHALYVTGRRALRAQTQCAVLDRGDARDREPDAEPPFALQHGLRYLLQMADVKDVVENAELQLGRPPTSEEAVTALRFYVEHDAFVELLEAGAGEQADTGEQADK